MQDNGNVIVGYGASTDIIEASAKAYIDAINKIVPPALRRVKEKSINKKAVGAQYIVSLRLFNLYHVTKSCDRNRRGGVTPPETCS